LLNLKQKSSIRNPKSAMHVIRLRAPWEVEPLEESPNSVRCTRHFNKPTGLDDGQRVWLVIDGLACTAAVSLNDVPVGQASRLSPGDLPARFDITPLHEPRNKIVIEFECSVSSDPVASLGEVRLEIVSGP
jgi:Glycosyl hydrolase 2 galactose-binding domain-like